MIQPGRACVLALLCLLSLAAGWSGSSLGDSGSGADHSWDEARIDELEVRLPEPSADQGVLWTGQAVLLFGGSPEGPSMYGDEILRWIPGSDQVEDTGARLPEGRMAPVSAWNGTHAFILGGDGCLGDRLGDASCRDILRYDPQTDEVETMDARLPEGLWGMTGAWNGTHVLITGGRDNRAVLAYHPPTDTLETLDLELPRTLQGPAAAWADGALWVYGGQVRGDDGTREATDTILRVDPDAGTVREVGVELPTPRNHTAAITAPGGVHLFGGGDDQRGVDEVLFHDTTNGTLEVLSADLPTPRSRIAAVWTEEAGYLFGGEVGCGQDNGGGSCVISDILAYRLVETDHQEDDGSDPMGYDPWAKATIEETRPGHVEGDATESMDPDGTIVSYSWDWGDGTDPATEPIAEHTYDEPGTYEVSVNVTDDDGRYDTVETLVTVENLSPTARFDRQGGGLSPTFDASNASDPDGEIASYTWSWGDGTEDSHGKIVDHTFETQGTYQVTLTVTDQGGASDQATQAVDITKANLDPDARFGVHVDDLVVKASAYTASDADGHITGYRWDWGDGTQAHGQRANHTYDQAGTYEVTLTVTDDQGATDTAEKTVEATAKQVPTGPTARFDLDATGRMVSVDAQASSGGSAEIQGYTWSWGDGTATSQGLTSLHTYERTGSYIVELTVTNADGQTDRATRSVDVSNLDPQARFEVTTDGLTATVDADQARDPDGALNAYRWSWGDGSPVDHGPTAHHAYQRAGVYTVTLVVQDQDDATDRVDRRIEVGGPSASGNVGADSVSPTGREDRAPQTIHTGSPATPTDKTPLGSAIPSEEPAQEAPGPRLLVTGIGVTLVAIGLGHPGRGRRKD